MPERASLAWATRGEAAFRLGTSLSWPLPSSGRVGLVAAGNPQPPTVMSRTRRRTTSIPRRCAIKSSSPNYHLTPSRDGPTRRVEGYVHGRQHQVNVSDSMQLEFFYWISRLLRLNAVTVREHPKICCADRPWGEFDRHKKIRWAKRALVTVIARRWL